MGRAADASFFRAFAFLILHLKALNIILIILLLSFLFLFLLLHLPLLILQTLPQLRFRPRFLPALLHLGQHPVPFVHQRVQIKIRIVLQLCRLHPINVIILILLFLLISWSASHLRNVVGLVGLDNSSVQFGRLHYEQRGTGGFAVVAAFALRGDRGHVVDLLDLAAFLAFVRLRVLQQLQPLQILLEVLVPIEYVSHFALQSHHVLVIEPLQPFHQLSQTRKELSFDPLYLVPNQGVLGPSQLPVVEV